MRAVIDTNVLIDYLAGLDSAHQELARHATPAISAITWMEVLVGAQGDEEAARLRSFLARFERLPIDDAVSDVAVEIRRERGIRLPDAIIWETARVAEAILVTRNTRDFPPDDPGVRGPYSISPGTTPRG